MVCYVYTRAVNVFDSTFTQRIPARNALKFQLRNECTQNVYNEHANHGRTDVNKDTPGSKSKISTIKFVHTEYFFLSTSN